MTKPVKTVTLHDFLTAAELKKATNRWLTHGDEGFVDWAQSEIIEPNMRRINKALKQANNPRYLAYALEFAMMKMGAKK